MAVPDAIIAGQHSVGWGFPVQRGAVPIGELRQQNSEADGEDMENDKELAAARNDDRSEERPAARQRLARTICAALSRLPWPPHKLQVNTGKNGETVEGEREEMRCQQDRFSAPLPPLDRLQRRCSGGQRPGLPAGVCGGGGGVAAPRRLPRFASYSRWFSILKRRNTPAKLHLVACEESWRIEICICKHRNI
jgi:hypothetical protein